MLRVDLHTHSTASPDGGLSLSDYRRALAGGLDVIAITDHNTISQAVEIKKILKHHIIVGEEVTTRQGEIIGLYLTEDIPPGLELMEAIRRIKQQGGLVYVPHPFERVQRHGLSSRALQTIIESIDVVETFNGRSFSLQARLRARAFVKKYQLAAGAGSDAHGPAGIGRVARLIAKQPTSDTLVELLRAGKTQTSIRRLRAMLEPSQNRRKNKLGQGTQG